MYTIFTYSLSLNTVKSITIVYDKWQCNFIKKKGSYNDKVTYQSVRFILFEDNFALKCEITVVLKIEVSLLYNELYDLFSEHWILGLNDCKRNPPNSNVQSSIECWRKKIVQRVLRSRLQRENFNLQVVKNIFQGSYTYKAFEFTQFIQLYKGEKFNTFSSVHDQNSRDFKLLFKTEASRFKMRRNCYMIFFYKVMSV